MNKTQSAMRALELAESRFRAGDGEAGVQLLLEFSDDFHCAVRLREWAVAERRLDLVHSTIQATLTADLPEAAVSRAVLQLLQGESSAALDALQLLIHAYPQLETAHHHAGRALQNLGRSDEAAATVQHALRLRADYPEAWYSLAHIERARGCLLESVDAYRTALRQMPAFRAALLNIGITLCALDQAEAALEPLDQLLRREPDAVDGLINKGLCLHILGRIAQSRACYELALQHAPDHPLAHFYLGCLLNEEMETGLARSHLEAALVSNRSDPDVLTELIGLLEQTNDLAGAASKIQEGLAHAPSHPGLNLEAARLDRRQGRIKDARERLLALDARALPTRLAQQYWFERGLLHDRAQEFDRAMEAWERGNALAALSPRRKQIDHNAFSRRCDQIARWLEQGSPGTAQCPDDPFPDLPFRPAFLVGFPRSGTTLLDTMLDAHPDVVSIEERATIEAVVEEILQPEGGYPNAMALLNPDALIAAREIYRRSIQPWLPNEFRGVLLDKLPLRLLRVPLIHRLFPDAPILFAVRHPCDVVLSNFMQQYVPNEAFVHFDSIADAARMYDQVMRLWRQMLETLPIRPHWVRYESLVADPAAELAAACAALKLEVREEMLDPAQRLKGRERIQTNSYQQVAEPIYRRAAGRWQHYRRWLTPVLPLLRPHIQWLGYDVEND
ncbi:MAG: sulfotransferase [Pseudomonadota bacterium]|nr:sulfotransferase [Pseudomonadota bacterium]